MATFRKTGIFIKTHLRNTKQIRNILVIGTLWIATSGCNGANGKSYGADSTSYKTNGHAPRSGTATNKLQLLVDQYCTYQIIADSFRNTHVDPTTQSPTYYDSALAHIRGQLAAYAPQMHGSYSIMLRGVRYNIFVASTTDDEISLHLYNDAHYHFISMGAVKDYLEAKGITPLMITNAGMYDQENNPIGLYVESGKQYHQLNNRKVPDGGNFYLQPNGVFYIDAGRNAQIDTTVAFARIGAGKRKGLLLATQSGPMLVIKGRINNAFMPGSVNMNIRSGAGIISGHKVAFAISVGGCNFYDFACLFRDVLGCKNALYLDGAISRMYLSDINPKETSGNFGGMIAVTKR